MTKEKILKLSPAMKEVILKMRAGETIYVRPSGYVRVAKTILSYARIIIQPSTVSALRSRGIIEEYKTIDIDHLYILTETGKSIEL